MENERVAEHNGKIFSKNILKLLKETIDATDEMKAKNEIDFFNIVSPIEAEFYSYCFKSVEKIKESIVLHSDSHFKILKRKSFYECSKNLMDITDAFYGFLYRVEKSNKKNYSHYYVEHCIGVWFFERNNNFITSERVVKKNISFFLLEKELLKSGLLKSVCENVVTALAQIYDLVTVYHNNYEGFLKAKNVLALHQKFRELNGAMHCLVGYSSKWYPMFNFINRDKKYTSYFTFK